MTKNIDFTEEELKDAFKEAEGYARDGKGQPFRHKMEMILQYVDRLEAYSEKANRIVEWSTKFAKDHKELMEIYENTRS